MQNLGISQITVMDFLLEEYFVQLVGQVTRTEIKGDTIEKGCIDYIYTNCPNKCGEASVMAAGSRAWLATKVTKGRLQQNNWLNLGICPNFC